MNRFAKFVLTLIVLASATPSFAGGGFKNEPFTVTRFLAFGGTGSGESVSSPLPFADEDLWAIPAGAVVEKVYVVVDTAITGTTVLNVGDDDDNDGYTPTASVTLATPGMYGWDAKTAGAYLRIQTAGATDAADIYVVPSAKYYSATGKEVKLDITTANTAGTARVVIEGYMLTK